MLKLHRYVYNNLYLKQKYIYNLYYEIDGSKPILPGYIFRNITKILKIK